MLNAFPCTPACALMWLVNVDHATWAPMVKVKTIGHYSRLHASVSPLLYVFTSLHAHTPTHSSMFPHLFMHVRFCTPPYLFIMKRYLNPRVQKKD